MLIGGALGEIGVGVLAVLVDRVEQRVRLHV